MAALGLTNAILVEKLPLGEQAINDEFEAHGSEEDKGNLRYACHCAALDDGTMPDHLRLQLSSGTYHGGSLGEGDFDFGHKGMRLEDFVRHPDSQLAQLPHALGKSAVVHVKMLLVVLEC